MVTTPVVLFGQVREATIQYWLKNTGRQLYSLDTIRGQILFDEFENSYECSWQINARDTQNDSDWHVPHFCSLGDWASNITDMLIDSRYDGLTFTTDLHAEILFRYYTRFLLVVSELINDFVDLLEIIQFDSLSKKDRLSGFTPLLDVDSLSGFINSVCKHKASPRQMTKFHHCNHHLPIFFEDSGQICTFHNPITKTKCDPLNPDGVVMPKLPDLVHVIVHGYQVIDEGFEKHHEKFEAFVSTHGKHL